MRKFSLSNLQVNLFICFLLILFPLPSPLLREIPLLLLKVIASRPPPFPRPIGHHVVRRSRRRRPDARRRHHRVDSHARVPLPPPPYFQPSSSGSCLSSSPRWIEGARAGGGVILQHFCTDCGNTKRETCTLYVRIPCEL